MSLGACELKSNLYSLENESRDGTGAERFPSGAMRVATLKSTWWHGVRRVAGNSASLRTQHVKSFPLDLKVGLIIKMEKCRERDFLVHLK